MCIRDSRVGRADDDAPPPPGAADAAGGAGAGGAGAGGARWATQTRATTVVCRWTIGFDGAVASDAARQHKGQYHDESFVDAAGNRWLLYYFLNGDGADNEVCARLSRRSRAALALLSRCSRDPARRAPPPPPPPPTTTPPPCCL